MIYPFLLVFVFVAVAYATQPASQVPLKQVLKRQPRTGTTITPEETVPSSLKKSNVLLLLDMVSPDLNDPTKGVKLELQTLEGGQWLMHDGAIYTGTTPPKPSKLPGVQPDTAFYLGKQIRGVITVITCSIAARAKGNTLFCEGTPTAGTVDVGVTIEIP